MEGRLKVSFYIPGVTLARLALYSPEAAASFRELAATGCVEFLGGTYSHSLASLAGAEALTGQVLLQQKALGDFCGQDPAVFVNPGLLYSDETGALVAGLGFRGMVAEGARHVLGWKSPGYLYCNADNPRLKVMMRNYRLCGELEEVLKGDNGGPGDAARFLSSALGPEQPGELVTLALEYERLEGLNNPATGMGRFLDHFFFLAGQTAGLRFVTPGEIAGEMQPASVIGVPRASSWTGEERDLSPWQGNELQEEALRKLYQLAPLAGHTADPALAADWNFLQVSDHFRFMADPPAGEGTPYRNPWEAFINYMNVLTDFNMRLEQQPLTGGPEEETNRLRKLLSEKEGELLKLKKEMEQLRKKKGNQAP